MNTDTRRPTSAAAPADTGDWRDDAECRTHPDPDLWFASEQHPGSRRRTAQALEVCNTRCAVRERCLAWALEQRVDIGVWGGMTERERQRLHRRRRGQYRGGVQTALDNILANRLTEFQTLEAQGLETAEIARVLGTNVNTVNRVREQLTGRVAEVRGKVVKAA
ncbi:WhiB family transcriptional regulator [Streptomyces mexicanus]|uniref:WhiB family transcriptional regulator n=1 Tax=Streptomyces mexicanus TaxID=178566 RepID=UPI00366A24D6